MAEGKQTATRGAFGWRVMVIGVVSMIAAAGLALLLIPQLSMRAAVRGTSISMGVFLAMQLGLWLSSRSNRSNP